MGFGYGLSLPQVWLARGCGPFAIDAFGDAAFFQSFEREGDGPVADVPSSRSYDISDFANR